MGLFDQFIKAAQEYVNQAGSYIASGGNQGSGKQGGDQGASYYNGGGGDNGGQNAWQPGAAGAQQYAPESSYGYFGGQGPAYQAPAPSDNQQQGNKEEPKAAGNEDEEDEKSLWDNRNKRVNFEQVAQNVVPQSLTSDDLYSMNNANNMAQFMNYANDINALREQNPEWETKGKLEEGFKNKTDETGAGNNSENSQASLDDEEFRKLWGLSEADYDKLEQGDQFRKALENSKLGKYYQDTYGIGGDMAYEQWRDIGQTNDYQGKHDLVRDVLGLGEDSSKAIPEWLQLYGNSGINIDRGENNERDEQIIQDVMDYMWGADNIINPYLWAENENNYARDHSLGGEGTAARLGEYFAENYYPSNGENIFQQFRNPETGEALFPQLDNKDFGIIAMAQNLANKDTSRYGDDNIAQIAAILNGAGDNASFGFLDEGEEGGLERASQTQYNLRDLMDAMQQYNLPYDVYGANGEPGVNSPIWSKIGDDIMADIARSTNKGIKRN